jgi:hypothetical protein
MKTNRRILVIDVGGIYCQRRAGSFMVISGLVVLVVVVPVIVLIVKDIMRPTHISNM